MAADPPFLYVRDHRRKPHVHPLASASGHVLTTVEPADHPWQRGLWFAVEFVDGDNFWQELQPYGVQRHQDDETVHWIRPDRQTVAIVERRRLSSSAVNDAVYALDWETVLVPNEAVVLDRTEYTTWGGYGGLAFRGRSDWAHTELTLDDGRHRDRVVGVPARWLDITGEVDGAVAGLTFLDHPDNPRHPVPWSASTIAGPGDGEGWANLVNAAFLFHEPLALAAGEELRLRYRIVVHDGAVGHQSIGRWWDDWTQLTPPP